MWRFVVDNEISNEFKETSNYVLGELDIQEKLVRKILRHNLDPKSKSYFEFLLSTNHQMRMLLHQPITKKIGGKRGVT